VFPRAFRPSLAVTLATVAFVALTVELGNWQLRRADEKLARMTLLNERRLQPSFDLNTGDSASPDLAWRRVRAQGVYLSRDALLIDSRIHDHIPGYHVVDPLEVSGSRAIVLVNRGWMAARLDGTHAAAPPPPSGPVSVEGIAAVSLEPKIRFVKDVLPAPGAERALWSNLDLNAYRKATGLTVLPFVVEQTGDAGDRLVRDWPGPPDDVPMHKAYALQWYTFAGIALALFVALNLKRRRQASS
jgi:surfeit locus 1 family protein